MKTYLITTHHNRDTRHERIKRELVGINYQSILAPDWKLFAHTNLDPKQYKRQSLTLAYYQICQTAVFEDVQEFIVMEDDVKIVGDVITPHSADLAYLTRTDHNRESGKTKPYNEHFDRIVSDWWETPITWWSIGFAHTFIEHIESKLEKSLWLGYIDHELIKLNETGRFLFLGAKASPVIGLSNSDQSEMSKDGSINLDNYI